MFFNAGGLVRQPLTIRMPSADIGLLHTATLLLKVHWTFSEQPTICCAHGLAANRASRAKTSRYAQDGVMQNVFYMYKRQLRIVCIFATKVLANH